MHMMFQIYCVVAIAVAPPPLKGTTLTIGFLISKVQVDLLEGLKKLGILLIFS